MRGCLSSCYERDTPESLVGRNFKKGKVTSSPYVRRLALGRASTGFNVDGVIFLNCNPRQMMISVGLGRACQPLSTRNFCLQRDNFKAVKQVVLKMLCSNILP